MKAPHPSTLLLLLFGAGSLGADTLFQADFSGSTVDQHDPGTGLIDVIDPATDNTLTTEGVDYLTSVTNLDAGTTVGSWSGLSTTGDNPAAMAVANSGAARMTGNYLWLGAPDDGMQTTSATIELSKLAALDGTVISMDAMMVNTGIEWGGLYVEGFSLSGKKVFKLEFGNGDLYRADIGHYDDLDDNTLAVDSAFQDDVSETPRTVTPVTITLGAGDFTVETGFGGSSAALSYVDATASDLARITFTAFDSKGSWGLDNIEVSGTPTPLQAVFSANFTGSTVDQSGGTDIVDAGEDIQVGGTHNTTPANLDAGTSVGSWSGVSTTAATLGNGALVVADTAKAIDGNYLYIGNSTNDTTFTGTATMDFTAVELDGATFTFDFGVFNNNVGGGNPTITMTGYDSLGTAVFAVHTSDNWRRPSEFLTLADQDNVNILGADKTLTNHNGFSPFTMNFGAADYSVDGFVDGNISGTATTGTASYLSTPSGDLSKIVISVDQGGKNADWGLDNLMVIGEAASSHPVPVITSFAFESGGTQARIKWDTVDGVTDILKGSSDLVNWNPITTVAGDGTEADELVPVTAPTLFYRVER